MGFHSCGRAPSLPCRAQEHQRRVAAVDIDRHCAATGTTDYNIGLMLAELGLSDPQGGSEIVVGEMGVEDFVAMVF